VDEARFARLPAMLSAAAIAHLHTQLHQVASPILPRAWMTIDHNANRNNELAYAIRFSSLVTPPHFRSNKTSPTPLDLSMKFADTTPHSIAVSQLCTQLKHIPVTYPETPQATKSDGVIPSNEAILNAGFSGPWTPPNSYYGYEPWTDYYHGNSPVHEYGQHSGMSRWSSPPSQPCTWTPTHILPSRWVEETSPTGYFPARRLNPNGKNYNLLRTAPEVHDLTPVRPLTEIEYKQMLF
jgi:hypothetical protein